MDLQYPVTVGRHKLKQAFVSWDALDNFVMELSNSLYNGAYIDEFRFTKGLVSAAFKSNQVQYEKVSAITSEATAKTFTTKVRELFLNMQLPSTEYNAWAKVGGYGREILTYSRPEDIVFLIRNDVRSYLDVNVLAEAFNMDKADLLGRIINIDNFDQYDDNGTKIYDGSDIIGFIGSPPTVSFPTATRVSPVRQQSDRVALLLQILQELLISRRIKADVVTNGI